MFAGKVDDDPGVHLGSAGLLVLVFSWLAWTFDHTQTAIIAGIIGVLFLIGGFVIAE